MNDVQVKERKERVCLSITRRAYASTLAYLNPTKRPMMFAMLTVGGLSIATRGLTVAQDLMLANIFGLGDALDALLTANLLPILAVNIIASSFSVALIPRYIQVRDRDGAEAGSRLVGCANFWIVAVLVAVAVALTLSFPLFLRCAVPNYSIEKRAMTWMLFLILLPVIVVRGLAVVWSGILNAENQFTIPCLVPAVTPTIVVVGVLVMGTSGNSVVAVAVATVIGAAVELAMLGVSLRRLHIHCSPSLPFADRSTVDLLYQFVPMVAGAAIMSSTDVINQSMASSLGTGSVAALNYGCKLVTWVVGFGALTVGTVVTPHFARMAAQHDLSRIIKTLHFYLRAVLLATVPAMVLLMVLAEPVTRLLFQRGSFTQDDTRIVASLQRWFALQIPIYVLNIVIVRLISCLRGNAILMWGAAINLVICVTLNLVFVPSMGIDGIALTSSIVLACSCAFSYIMLRQKIYGLREDRRSAYEYRNIPA